MALGLGKALEHRDEGLQSTRRGRRGTRVKRAEHENRVRRGAHGEQGRAR